MLSDSSSSIFEFFFLLFPCSIVILVPHSMSTSVSGVLPQFCSAVHDVVPPPLEGGVGGGFLVYGCSRVTGGLPQTFNTDDVCVAILISMEWVPRVPHCVHVSSSLGIGGYSLPSYSLSLFLSDSLPYSVFWVPRGPHGVPGPVVLVVG